MAIIYATKGQAIQVDDEWYEELSKFKWHVSTNGYATRNVYVPGQRKKPKAIYMHRVVLGLVPGDGIIADHINEDRLDNRRANLRGSTRAENGRNRGKNRRNTTGYKGVSIRRGPRGVRYYAGIIVNWKSIHIGAFDTPEEAHKAYCEAAKKYHGEFANFGDK